MSPVNFFIDTILAALILGALHAAIRFLNPHLRRIDRLNRRIADDCPHFGKDNHV